jgi:chromate transporter
MVLPGPEAQQLATYIGWLMHRTWGAIVAGTLFVLPSLLVLIALSWIYMAYGDVPAIAGILYGIKPAVVAIVLHAAWRIGSRALKHPALWAIAAAAFVAIFAFKVPFPAIVLAAGLIGALGGRIAPNAFTAGGWPWRERRRASACGDRRRHAHAAARALQLGAARARGRHLPGSVVAGHAMLVAAYGPDTPIGADGVVLFQGCAADVRWRIRSAALCVPGRRRNVWVAHTVQMVDGLALGETTPGPLIMVVAFVGFVGGWTRQIFGPNALALAGMAAACVVTFFHVSAELHVHPRRRPGRRIDARTIAIYRSTHRNHRSGGRCDRQSGVVLRVARVSAARMDSISMVRRSRRDCAGNRTRCRGRIVPVQGRRDSGDPRVRRCRVASAFRNRVKQGQFYVAEFAA